MIKSIKQRLKRLRGFSTPLFGLSWAQAGPDERDERINSVVHSYIELYEKSKASHLHGLDRARVYKLHDDEEIREACKRIQEDVEHNPIHESYAPKLDHKDLHHFFVLIHEILLSGGSFDAGDVEGAIDKTKSKEM